MEMAETVNAINCCSLEMFIRYYPKSAMDLPFLVTRYSTPFGSSR